MDVMDMMDDELYGHVVVIKRDGSEGGRFPLYDDALIGRCVLFSHVLVNHPSHQHARPCGATNSTRPALAPRAILDAPCPVADVLGARVLTTRCVRA